MFVGGTGLLVQLATSTVIVASYVAAYLLAARAVGVETPLLTLAPLVAPVLLSMLLPLSIGGWGVRETAAAAIWSVAGLAASDGVAISVAYGLVVLVGGPLVGSTLGDVIRAYAEDRDEETTAEDPMEELRQRYARGELTEDEFERKVERLLETEDVEVPAGSVARTERERESEP